MQFNHNNTTYRLERGLVTNVWILLVIATHGGWRLVETFDAAIYDEDIQDRALIYLQS